jgi:hypothetical protein
MSTVKVPSLEGAKARADAAQDRLGEALNRGADPRRIARLSLESNRAWKALQRAQRAEDER